MFYSSVLIIMHTNVFIMLAMLGNYHHYLIQGFFFFFSTLKTETPFLKYRVPLPLSVGIIYTFLHEWPQSRYLIHVKSYTLCPSMSALSHLKFSRFTGVIACPYQHLLFQPYIENAFSFSFFTYVHCTYRGFWKGVFVHVYMMLYHVVSLSCLP